LGFIKSVKVRTLKLYKTPGRSDGSGNEASVSTVVDFINKQSIKGA